MNRIFVASLLASLVACEGEPPVNSPENPSTAPSAAPSAAAVEAPTPLAPAPVAMPMHCPMMPCADAAPPAEDAGAPDSAPPAEVAAGPVVPGKYGNVVGTVTGQPAAIARSAIVYIERHPGDTNPAAQTVTIDNRQMNFIPYVQVASVGAKVVFANGDPFPHNVFSPDNEKFNLGNIPQSGAHTRTFDHPGAYTLLCNLHPGMIGYLLVVPSTHFVRVDAKGKFTMKGVPVGTYDVSAWAPRLKPVTQSVTVTESDVTANFELHR